MNHKEQKHLEKARENSIDTVVSPPFRRSTSKSSDFRGDFFRIESSIDPKLRFKVNILVFGGKFELNDGFGIK